MIVVLKLVDSFFLGYFEEHFRWSIQKNSMQLLCKQNNFELKLCIYMSPIPTLNSLFLGQISPTGWESFGKWSVRQIKCWPTMHHEKSAVRNESTRIKCPHSACHQVHWPPKMQTDQWEATGKVALSMSRKLQRHLGLSRKMWPFGTSINLVGFFQGSPTCKNPNHKIEIDDVVEIAPKGA